MPLMPPRVEQVLAVLFFLQLPAWLIVGLCLWTRQENARRRREPGRCLRCRYDLTGNRSGRCPECGQWTSAGGE